MRFLVTGATGFVGGAIIRLLRASGHEVRALVRSPERAVYLVDQGIAVYKGDVGDRDSLRAPMAGVDGVFHTAGWYKVGRSDSDVAIHTNVDGTRHVCELMTELAVPRGVYTSTLAINSDTHGQVVDETYEFHGRHLSLYDRTKAEAHKVALSFAGKGTPIVVVQPGLVYGPGDTSSVRTMLRQYLQRTLPLIPKRTAFSWGHVDDIARGHLLAMEQGVAGRNYYLAGPAHTFVEALSIAKELTGIRAPRLRAPPAVMRGASVMSGLIEKLVRLPPEYTAEGLRVLAGTTYLGSNARAKAELGWSVRPLREGMRETLRHEMQLLGMPAKL